MKLCNYYFGLVSSNKRLYILSGNSKGNSGEVGVKLYTRLWQYFLIWNKLRSIEEGNDSRNG